MLRRNTIVLLTTVALIAPMICARADMPSLDPQLALPLLFKVLAYDESLDARHDSTIAAYAVYDPDNAASYRLWTKSKEFVRNNPDLRVRGRRVDLRPLALAQSKDPSGLAVADRYGIILLLNIDSSAAVAVADTARARGYHTFAFPATAMPPATGVALTWDGNRPAIVVNLPVTQAEGSQYSSRLLQVCRVIR